GGNPGPLAAALHPCPSALGTGQRDRRFDGVRRAKRLGWTRFEWLDSQSSMSGAQIVGRDGAGLLHVDFREMLARAGEVFVLCELAVAALIERLEQGLAAVDRALHLRLACGARPIERALGRGLKLVVIDDAVAIGVEPIELSGGKVLGILQGDEAFPLAVQAGKVKVGPVAARRRSIALG